MKKSVVAVAGAIAVSLLAQHANAAMAVRHDDGLGVNPENAVRKFKPGRCDFKVIGKNYALTVFFDFQIENKNPVFNRSADGKVIAIGRKMDVFSAAKPGDSRLDFVAGTIPDTH